MYIELTKYPERASGMGLSMSMGAGTPPAPYVPKVHLWSANSAWTETFADNKIPNNYYSGRTDIIKVVVDSGLTDGDSAFSGCTNLSSVTLNGFKTVIASTFRGCTNLVDVKLWSGCTRLEGWVFMNCTSLSSITIPDNVTLIGGYSFQGCTALEEVVLGSGLANVNIQCFDGCISLSSITCTASTAPALGYNVFRNMASDGTLYVPVGSDYSTWVAALPINWTVEYI